MRDELRDAKVKVTSVRLKRSLGGKPSVVLGSAKAPLSQKLWIGGLPVKDIDGLPIEIEHRPIDDIKTAALDAWEEKGFPVKDIRFVQGVDGSPDRLEVYLDVALFDLAQWRVKLGSAWEGIRISFHDMLQDDKIKNALEESARARFSKEGHEATVRFVPGSWEPDSGPHIFKRVGVTYRVPHFKASGRGPSRKDDSRKSKRLFVQGMRVVFRDDTETDSETERSAASSDRRPPARRTAEGPAEPERTGGPDHDQPAPAEGDHSSLR